MVGESPQTQAQRYSRHLLLPQVGPAGQEKLTQARVLVVGAGGLGAPVLTYLAAAGVGTLGVIDDDVVELSNLQRQVIHKTSAVGTPKVDSAAKFLAELNPNTELVTYPERLTAANVFDIIADWDLIVDGTDNFTTRYLLNDACVVAAKPYVWAAIFQFNAVVSIFHAGAGPCYRCIYPTPPPPGSVPSCAEGGVIGALPGLVGTTQALEVIKLIIDIGTPLRGTIAAFDGLTNRWEYLPSLASPSCPTCAPGRNRTAADVQAEWQPQPTPETEPQGAVQNDYQIQPEELAAFLIQHNARLIDVRTPAELAIVAIPGAENIELAQILEASPLSDREETVVVLCKSGMRSAQAAAHLRENGHVRVYELRGGILDWVARVAPHEATY